MPKRLKITVEYDGTGYVGWQAQKNGPSVQETLEKAIKKFSGETLRISGAGRTDAGVHALGQVAHFDLNKEMSAKKIMAAINAYLQGEKVVVIAAEFADTDFDARFSATARHYLYRILNRPARPGLEKNRVWHVPKPLNEKAMDEAAKRLIGKHDFTIFRSIHCQAKSPVKTLDRLDVSRHGDEIQIRASARSFLHHQVRSMAGTLKLVGEGKWTADDVTKALEAQDRKALGFNAPPEGLYLIKVDY